ncbi:hypothetical protein FB451DRAFT_642562 [Mycena latifolia]|nr:hypothetical protein FB451DRAFT_642562 [Mycena latifolia]
MAHIKYPPRLRIRVTLTFARLERYDIKDTENIGLPQQGYYFIRNCGTGRYLDGIFDDPINFLFLREGKKRPNRPFLIHVESPDKVHIRRHNSALGLGPPVRWKLNGKQGVLNTPAIVPVNTAGSSEILWSIQVETDFENDGTQRHTFLWNSPSPPHVPGKGAMVLSAEPDQSWSNLPSSVVRIARRRMVSFGYFDDENMTQRWKLERSLNAGVDRDEGAEKSSTDPDEEEEESPADRTQEENESNNKDKNTDRGRIHSGCYNLKSCSTGQFLGIETHRYGWSIEAFAGGSSSTNISWKITEAEDVHNIPGQATTLQTVTFRTQSSQLTLDNPGTNYNRVWYNDSFPVARFVVLPRSDPQLGGFKYEFRLLDQTSGSPRLSLGLSVVSEYYTGPQPLPGSVWEWKLEQSGAW